MYLILTRPLKPIILTRDAVQKHVFGMGYTNLPVISIEEFYDERARNGWYDKPQPDSLLNRALKNEEEVIDKEAEEARIKVKIFENVFCVNHLKLNGFKVQLSFRS
jgi:hypothetical protein